MPCYRSPAACAGQTTRHAELRLYPLSTCVSAGRHENDAGVRPCHCVIHPRVSQKPVSLYREASQSSQINRENPPERVQLPRECRQLLPATVTTKQLVSNKPQTLAVARCAEWPDYVIQCFERRGKSKEDILAVGMFLIEVDFVGKDYSILYVVPRDKRTLFPDARPPILPSIAEITPGVFDSELFCKYLQKGKCHACGAIPAPGSKLQACSRCKKGCYCNRDCQTADWPEHKAVCKMLQEVKDAGADMVAKHLASRSSSSSNKGAS